MTLSGIPLSGLAARFLVVGWFFLGGFPVQAQVVTTGAPAPTMGRPGYLIVSSARDSSAGFHWQAGPGQQQKSLVWASGQLIIPDSMTLEPFGADDLGVGTTASLQGNSDGGTLKFRDGHFVVDQPLLLTDGVLSLFAAAGELEIRGAQVRYLPPTKDEAKKPALADPMAGFLFLAGLVLLIVVLMRRARLRTKDLKP